MKRFALALVALVAMTASAAAATHADVRKDCAALRQAGMAFVGEYQSKLWFAGEHNSRDGHISNFVVNEADHYVTYILISNFDRSYEQLVATQNVATVDCENLVFNFAHDAAEYLEAVTTTGVLPFAIAW